MNTQEEPKTGIKFLDNIFFDSETNRYGIISLLLIAAGCLGGVAVATGGLSYTIELIFLVTSTMLCLSLILAVAPMRLIIYSSIFSILSSVIIIALNLLVL